MKLCTKCGETKDLTCFSKNLSTKDKLSCWCSPCNRQAKKISHAKHKAKNNATSRAWKLANPEKQREITLKGLYDLTPAQWDIMFVSQNGCCAICGTHQSALRRALHTDHCHVTGKVRGLLCRKCNTAIGMLRDDPALTKSATDYLLK